MNSKIRSLVYDILEKEKKKYHLIGLERIVSREKFLIFCFRKGRAYSE